MADEIKFASVKLAIIWSEELAQCSRVKSTLGALIGKPGTGKLTRQEMIDIAQTISTMTAMLKPYKGAALKAVYGGRDRQRDHEIGIAIATRLVQMGAAKDKKHSKLITLGESTVRSVRSVELLGRRYGINRMAKDIGISRSRFYKSESWRTLRYESKQLLWEWLESGENDLWLELDVRGWIA